LPDDTIVACTTKDSRRTVLDRLRDIRDTHVTAWATTTVELHGPGAAAATTATARLCLGHHVTDGVATADRGDKNYQYGTRGDGPCVDLLQGGTLRLARLTYL
jgi:hypothetical protein